MGDSGEPCLVVALTGPQIRKRVECVGASYLLYHSIREHGAGRARGPDRAEDEDHEGTKLEDNIDYLRSLDPKEWKEQDHYAVLGLGKLRYNATEEDIKKAYRFKVLRHHPDKRRAQGKEVRGDNDYFTCITKAYEILGIPNKRRSYDSVDPYFDDSLPTQSEIKKDFYKTCNKYFESNSRWCEKKNVPLLGDDSTPREKVEKFYSFWYDFESWREYSYHDEEDKEKGQDREDRRCIEKQNKVVRAKKKKEEMARIRTLVDLAYSNDPRIVRFKQEDKDKKLAVKKARQDAAQARKAEEERVLREERLAKEKLDQEQKAKAECLKAEKEALKKIMKREKKMFRDLCKSNNYYTSADGNDNELIEHMAGVEKIVEAFKLFELQELNKNLEEGKEENGRDVFLEAFNETEKRLEEERNALLQASGGGQSRKEAAEPAGVLRWTPELVQILIKAVNCFPAGTNQRWEVIANFVNQHGTFEDCRQFAAKDVLSKAKDLQSSDFSKSSLKVAANKEAFDKFEKEKKKPPNAVVDDTGISISFDSNKGLVNGKPSAKGDDKKEEVPWSKMEQGLLEQAIKTYPVNTPERWDRIAECIPNRTKKDCMKRFKELVDLVKAKKQAAALIKK